MSGRARADSAQPLSAALARLHVTVSTQFLQKLEPPRNFALEAAHSAPFLIVFVDPPQAVNRYAIVVAKAVPGESQPAAPARAGRRQGGQDKVGRVRVGLHRIALRALRGGGAIASRSH